MDRRFVRTGLHRRICASANTRQQLPLSAASVIAIPIAWLMFGGVPAVASEEEPADVRQEESGETPAHLSEAHDTIERRAVLRRMRRDLDRISLGTASRFHRRAIRTFERTLPKDVEVAYWGPLALDRSHPSLRVHGGGFTSALEWAVQKDIVLFTFWISTARAESTAAVSQVNGTNLYLNVSHVDGGRSVNQPLEELGGLSVVQALKLLESPLPAKVRPTVDPEEAGKDDAATPAEQTDASFRRLIEIIQSNQDGWEDVDQSRDRKSFKVK